MSALPWILGGLAAAGGVAYVVIRKHNAAAAQGGSACASIAQPIGRLYGFDIPPSACGAVDAVLGKVAGAFTDHDAKNRQLNGEIAIPLDAPTKSIARTFRQGQPNAVDFLTGSVLEFKNGCQPFAGAPGFGKCAPGTTSMLNGPGGFMGNPPGERPPSTKQLNKEFMLALATRVARPDKLMTGEAWDPASSAALGILGGVKATCPTGQKVLGFSPVRDGRSGELVRAIITNCGADASAPDRLAQTTTNVGEGGRSDGGLTHTQTAFGSTGALPADPPPPGYHWVAATGTSAGHWERDRAGAK